jgi:hypothetical protein
MASTLVRLPANAVLAVLALEQRFAIELELRSSTFEACVSKLVHGSRTIASP